MGNVGFCEEIILMPKSYKKTGNASAFPSAGCATGQHQTAVRDGKSDFLRFHMSAESLGDGGVDHVGEHCGLQARGIGID